MKKIAFDELRTYPDLFCFVFVPRNLLITTQTAFISRPMPQPVSVEVGVLVSLHIRQGKPSSAALTLPDLTSGLKRH